MGEALDCLVIGGGPGGLAAATYLARFRRSVLVADAGASRAALIPVSHNLPGYPDGIPGPRLLANQRAQAVRYGARLITATVTRLERYEAGFTATLQTDGEQRWVTARTALLATGVVDIEPALPDLPDAIHQGLVRHCPICDGYEVSGQRIGVLGFGAGALGEALFLRTWSDDVTLLTAGGAMDMSDDERRRLAEAGIAVVAQPVAQVTLAEGRISCLRMSDGSELGFDTLYSALGARVRSELAVALGADRGPGGALRVDDHQRTSVPGLWAAGDVVDSLNQIACAWGHAAIAATDIHRQL